MRVAGRDFGDLIQMVDEDELTMIVTEAEALQDAPAHARCIAVMLLALRDEGDGSDRQLAATSIRDYFRRWLRHRPTEGLRGRVESE